MAAEPDSAYIFAYSTLKNDGRNGLHFAWSPERKNWFAIGPELRYLFSDYGRWGSQKRLVTPFLLRDKNKKWHCMWTLNETDGVLAHTSSDYLTYWLPQTYPDLMTFGNCLDPELSFDSKSEKYMLSWLSKDASNVKIFGAETLDFKTYTLAGQLSEKTRLNSRENIQISGITETGTVHKVEWAVVQYLLNYKKLEDFKRIQNDETTKDDPVRFAAIKSVDATIAVDEKNGKKISNMLMGIFFEDINYAADGGLYAELSQNRDFEYCLSDKEGRDKNWNSYKAWSLKGENSKFRMDTLNSIHPNNKHYAVLEIIKTGAGLQNEGFSGIALTAGDKYDFSIFIRNLNRKTMNLSVRLIGKSGEVIGETTLNSTSKDWKKINAVITCTKTVSDSHLEIIPESAGIIHLDMISLFPQKTFKNRKNGLRADLAQTIADLNPRFVRFPGGCVAHGDGIHNIYRWENTIGSLESRVPQRNLWGYHQTAGLGYFEYFQFCEDMGAEAVPVVAAGVPCQNSATGGAGQQGGIPMCEMHDYVQDVLNLIEWANGDPKKSVWARKRAEAGHPKPFNLKYIGVGNEDLINSIFEERFTLIYKAVKDKYPEITLIGTVGPFNEGTDYVEGWKIADKLNLEMVDEHYYQTPGWFLNNNEFYDKYDRNKSKVYLGEYAAHLPGRPNNLETALTEAHYLTALERNGDIVSMTSYAPLLAKEGFTQWNPDLIYFNNSEVKLTVGYFVQKLYGQNSGDEYLKNNIILSDNNVDIRKRLAVSVVRDTKSKDLIIKLVNLLPFQVNSKIDLKALGITHSKAEKTVMQGNPKDKKVIPKSSFIEVTDSINYDITPYSFTVFRIYTNETFKAVKVIEK
jgi:alpha-L-arabinofuranosidase